MQHFDCIIISKKGVLLIKNQIKKLRKKLDMTQQEFADRLGVKRNNIAGYETGTRNPSDGVVSLICREFNVNEDWLRNGTGGDGNMFQPESREDEIARTVKNLLNGENDTFKHRFISMLSRLSASDWERLEAEARKLFEPEKETSSPEPGPQDETDWESEYKKSVLEPAAKKAFTASNTTADTGKETNKAANQ